MFQTARRPVLACAMAMLGAMAAVAATADDPPDDAARLFESRVRPLLHERCLPCHGANQAGGGLRLDSRGSLLKGGGRGPSLIPGQPAASLLLRAVRHEGSLHMPPALRLAESEISVLERWIAQGAPWPSYGTKPGSVSASAHWSFQPVRRPAIPRVGGPLLRVRGPVRASSTPSARAWAGLRIHGASPAIRRPTPHGARDSRVPIEHTLSVGIGVACRAEPRGRKGTAPRAPHIRLSGSVVRPSSIVNPIDAFILAKLRKNGLEPAPRADRRTLIRRATFDLTGLPPTPQEVEAFLNDRSPNAWEKVVDRLLASPHYGERWARHWLDVARYADSNGLDENLAFANAFRYRDWVVEALNRDMPYDRFLTEQIAGDLLPSEDEAVRNSRITATGFLALGAKVLAEQDKAKLVMDIVDEQIEVVSKAAMGLTVACARCHDHKFDPITTRDYYALAGIFKSTRTMQDLGFVSAWLERPLSTRQVEAQIAAWQPRIDAARARLQAAVDSANAEVVAGIRARAGDYLLAAWDLLRTPGLVSLAETPPAPGEPPRIVIEAEQFDRGNVARDSQTYGQGIGVIHNLQTPDFAEWDCAVPSPGTYQFELRYAAAESRQVKLSLNGRVVRERTAGAVTGSWTPDGQRWEPQGVFTLRAGTNTLRIDCAGPIPHFDKILMVSSDVPEGTAPPRTADEIASSRGLHASIVERWARLLGQAAPGTLLASLRAYGVGGATPPDLAALAPGLKDLSGDREAAARLLARMLEEGRASAAREAAADPKGLFGVPEDASRLHSPAARESLKSAAEALAKAEEDAPRRPLAMAVEEGRVENCRVHIRGDGQTLGEEVPRGFVAVLSQGPPIAVDPARSGRLELARWLSRPEHPLTARVIVNRLWQCHFGEGLVRTPDNWGLLGEKPTHPELLDWLAAELVNPTAEAGGCRCVGARAYGEPRAHAQASAPWSLKRMHRLIMLSEAYQRSSTPPAGARETDPDNRLLSHMSRRRLEAEAFRDAILAVSGRLDRTLGGSLLGMKNREYVTNDQSGNAARYDQPRRSLYLPVIRNALFDMFQAFDFGDPTMVNARRATTTVAPQALWVMNSPFVLDQSRAFAELLLALPGDASARITEAWMRAFARRPSQTEVRGAREFLSGFERHLAGAEDDPARRRARAWQALCHALLASNEFLHVD